MLESEALVSLGGKMD